MDKAYSRNLARRKIFAAQFPQAAFQGNRDAASIVERQSVISEERPNDKNPRTLNFRVAKPADWALDLLKTGIIGSLKKGSGGFERGFRGNCCAEWSIRKKSNISHTEKANCENGILLLSSEEIEWLNYRCPTESLSDEESLLHLCKLECQDIEREGIDCDH